MKKLLHLATSFLLLGMLSACSTTVGSNVNSAVYVDSLKGNYRLVSVSQDSKREALEIFDGLNRIYKEGFTEITFSSDEDLEKIVKEKRMGNLGFNLHSCQSKLGLYAGSVYRKDELDSDDLYYIFLPKNLDLAIAEYTSFMGRDLGKVSLPKDLNELCIKVSAYRLHGEEIKLSLGAIESLK